MNRPRILPEALRRSAARLGGSVLALAAVWWIGHEAWGAGFRSATRAMLSAASLSERVELLPVPAPRRAARAEDTVVRITDASGVQGVTFEISSLRLGFIPFAVVGALAFASPGALRWRERRRALATALAAAGGWVVVSVLITLARIAMREPSVGLRAPGPVRLVTELAYRVLVNPPGFEYVVPAFLWFLSAARRGAGAPARTAATTAK